MPPCLRGEIIRAIFAASLAALLTSAPSRAQEHEDEGPLRVMSSGEMELERRRKARPVLECSPSGLDVTVKRGETRRLRLTVRNGGGRVLEWLVTFSPNWAGLTRESGELGFEKEEVTYVTIDTTRLPVGRTRGQMVIEAPGAAGSPRSVPVSLTVIRPKPVRPPPEPERPKPPSPGVVKPAGPWAVRIAGVSGGVAPNVKSQMGSQVSTEDSPLAWYRAAGKLQHLRGGFYRPGRGNRL